MSICYCTNIYSIKFLFLQILTKAPKSWITERKMEHRSWNLFSISEKCPKMKSLRFVKISAFVILLQLKNLSYFEILVWKLAPKLCD